MNISNVFNNIKLAKKMAIIAFLALLSIVIPTTYFYDASIQKEHKAELELFGLKFVNQTIQIRKLIAEHRGITERLFAGDKSAENLRFEKSMLVDKSFETIDNMLASSIDPALMTHLKRVERAWASLKSNIANRSIERKYAFKAHSELIANAGDLTSALMQKYELYYDPTSASYHAIAANYLDLPRLANTLGKVRGKGAGILAQGTISQLELGELEGFLSEINYPARDFIKNIDASSNADERFKEYHAIAVNFQQEFAELNLLVKENIIDVQTLTMPSALYYDRFTSVIDAIYDFNQSNSILIGQVLLERIEQHTNKRLFALSIIVVSFVLCLLFGAMIIRSIMASITQIQTRFDALQAGDYSNVSQDIRTDEFGELNNNLSEVTQSLANGKQIADEALRVKQALDNSSTSFVLTDPQHVIIYANPIAQGLLSTTPNQVNNDQFHSHSNQLLGQNIDMFFNGVADIRSVLPTLTKAYSTTIKLAELDLRTIINPIFDEHNAVMGYSTEFHDMTDIFEEERKKQRILESLSCASTNIMIANADRNIIYLNQSINNMFVECEEEFRRVNPNFVASNIINNSIDVFNHDLAQPTFMLDTLHTTQQAEITIGNRYFRIITNPIITDTGERLGSVIEWLDRTKEVIAEQEIIAMVNSALQGDFSFRASIHDKAGFLLSTSQGLNELMNITESGLNDVAKVLLAISKGDLTQRVEAEYTGTFNDLKDYCNTSCNNLTAMIANIRTSALTIDTAASEIAQGNMDLSSRTEQQASSLEETAASMDEINGTINLNAQNAEQANHLVADAVKVAFSGGDLIKQVVTTMGSINDSADQISNIIGVIDSIAFQTNILALNAAVEAARAGEQGRGFAVVAAEVRTLAQRSANAAKDIKSLISESVNNISTGNELVHQSGQTMEDIVSSIQRVNDIMGEIAAASRQQATSISEVNNAVSQMDEMTQQNAALVEQAAASSESLRGQSSVLTQNLLSFQLDDLVANEAELVQQQPMQSQAASVKLQPSDRLQPQSPSATDDWESF